MAKLQSDPILSYNLPMVQVKIMDLGTGTEMWTIAKKSNWVTPALPLVRLGEISSANMYFYASMCVQKMFF